MQTITITPHELKKIMRDTFIDVLTERRDLIEDAVIGAIEDIGLGVAMEKGRTGEYIDNQKFRKRLEHRIKSAK
jgi:hypothetical protein